MCVRLQFLYLHASWAHQTPPVPVQAKDEGVGQAMERCRQDVQQGEGEGRILRVEGIMKPGGGERDREVLSSPIKNAVNKETTCKRASEVRME